MRVAMSRTLGVGSNLQNSNPVYQARTITSFRADQYPRGVGNPYRDGVTFAKHYPWHDNVPLRYRPIIRLGMSIASFKLLWPNHFLNRSGHEGAYLPREEFIKRVGAKPFPFVSLDKKTALQGYWIPASPGQPSDKTVMLLHGYTALPQQFTEIIEYFQKKGYNVMTFDFRGHGKSAVTPTSIGGEKEALDFGAAFIEALKRHDKVKGDGRGIFVLGGYSMGGATIMQAHQGLQDFSDLMATMVDRVDAIMLDSPYATFNLAQHKKTQEIKGLFNFERWKRIVDYCAKSFGEDRSQRYLCTTCPMDRFSPLTSYQDSPLNHKPTLHLHGLYDEMFPHARHAGPIRELLQSVVPEGLLTMVDLEAMHSNAWNLPGRPEYRRTLRDENKYLSALGGFIQQVEQLARQQQQGNPSAGEAAVA